MLGVVVCVCHPNNGRKFKIGQQSRPAWAKSKRYFLQNNQSRKAGDMAQR
jgi:hypothetical protein